jgi:putative peptidoglycan lipid II flippase
MSARRSFARNTVIFSVATGLSRVAGLAREILASSYFGTSGPFSAFTIAFQVPNVVRSLFADAALGAAFVPVFTELLEHDKKKEAYRLASTLFFLILAVLGSITALFMIAAPYVMPLFTGDAFTEELDQLTIGLSRVMFPIVLILGLNGLIVGILNAHDHFTIPALSPLVWNVVIMVFLVGSKPFFEGEQEMYAYAIGVLAGTIVQFGMALPVLRRVGFQFEFELSWRDPKVRRVLVLMLPVTIGLGLINFNVLVNSTLGALVSQEAPRAIDAAFRIYMLPQGVFSVAIATVLFPALSRLAARQDLDGLRALCSNGVRLIFLLLLPAAAATVALAEPITRLIYERGAFDAESTDQVAEALFWFSFSLPFSGVNLLLTRTFFSLQRPWATTALAGVNIAVNIVVSVALYEPFGIAGIVIGTAASSFVMALAQAAWLRRLLQGRFEGAATALAIAGSLVAAAAFGAVAWVVWTLLDELLGRSLIAQVISVGGGLGAGAAAYVALVLWLRIPEAAQVRDLVARRRGAGEG